MYVCVCVCLCVCMYFFGDANSFVHSANGSSQHAPANPSLMHLTSWGMDHLWGLWKTSQKKHFVVALALFAKLNPFGPPEVGFHVNSFIWTNLKFKDYSMNMKVLQHPFHNTKRVLEKCNCECKTLSPNRLCNSLQKFPLTKYWLHFFIWCWFSDIRETQLLSIGPIYQLPKCW